MLLHQALRLALDPAHPDVVATVGGGGKSTTAFRLAAEVAATGRRAIVAPSTRIAAFQTAWAPAFLEVSAARLPWQELERLLATHGYCLLGGPVAGDRRLGLDPEQIDELSARAADLGIAAITVEADGSKMRPIKAPAAHEPVLPASTTLLAPVVGLDAVGRPIDARAVHRPELVRAVLGLADDAPANLTPAMLARLLCDPAGGAKGLLPTMQLLPLLNKADSPLHLTYGRLTAALLAQAGQPSLLTSVGAGNPAPVVERWGAVAVIVLAAGGSRRMGRPKQLEAVGGEAMVVRAARVALAAGAGPVAIVTGAEADAVAALLGEQMPALDVIHNPDWESGQATSMKAALRALPASVEAAILMPVDQPYLDELLLRRLVQAWRTGADLVAPAIAGALRGAPALFDRRFWPELMAVTGDVGGRRVLAAHHDVCAAVPAEAAWLRDIDTPDDL